jgi:thioredoxin-related protein
MKSGKTIGAIFALLLLMTFSVLAEKSPTVADAPESEAAAKIQWMRYDEGLAKAKAEDKHVMVDFSTSWCVYCKKMDKETFTKPDVIKLLNDNFVAIKVDGDSKQELDIEGYKTTEKELTKKEYGVRGYPAFWFLKSDGTKLAQIKGYRPADYMIEALNYIKDEKYDTTKTDGSSSGE